MKKIYTLAVLAALSCSALAQPGIIRCYTFDGNSNDARMSGNNGTNYNVVLGSDRNGAGSSAYVFGGSQSAILVDNSTLQLAEYSYSVWIKPTELPNNAYVSIFANGGSNYDQHLLIAHDPANNKYGFSYGSWSSNGTGNTCVPGITPPVNQWTHVVVVRSADSMMLYVNGSMICGKAASGVPAYTGNNNTLSFGSRGTTMSQNFKGSIDDVKIFNRALTGAEVQAVANGSCFGVGINDKVAALPKSIYNCVGEQLVIQSEDMAGEVKKVQVYSLNDQLLISADKDVNNLNLSNFADGMYIVRVELAQGSYVTQKIIKGL